jgi:hypothetical protein
MIPGLEIPPQYGYPLLALIIGPLVGFIVNRALKNKPGAPTVTEAWDETRKVREEMTDMRAAFDVAFRWIERATRDWNSGKPLPRFSAHDREVIAKIRPIPEPEPPATTGPIPKEE